PFAAGAQAEAARRAQRLLHLSAILGLAALARTHCAAPLRAGALYFSLRREVLRRCGGSGEIHRSSAGWQGCSGSLQAPFLRPPPPRPLASPGYHFAGEPQIGIGAPRVNFA